jgi:cytochrome P450
MGDQRSQEQTVAGYDPLAPETVEDPFPAYEWLRSRCPVHRTEQFGHPLYTLSRRADVHTVLTHPEQWSNTLGPGVGYSGTERMGDIQRFDPPDHTARRRFARPEFNPVRVVERGDEVRALAGRLVDEMLAAGSPAELHDDFAMPLPIVGFIDMMGVDQADAAKIKHWADELVRALADPTAAGPSFVALGTYLLERVVDVRRRADAAGLPGDEAIGAVVPEGLLSTYALRLFEGERMDEREMAGMLTQLMVAGHETTTSLITNLVFRLLERRERWEAVVADPSLAEAAVEESLRYDPPVLGLCRTNNEPVMLGDEQIEPGTKVMVLYASANRDPAAFEEPDEFRLDRPWTELRRHYSFGWGVHHCLGAPIARQTARIALETLVARLPGLELAGPTERIASEFLWGRRVLPVRW